ncbi:MAG: hypothetical protein SVW51_16675 [Pseudomonadota bacterium]|nr:hypothetical protein [Pseudomonadota bacterium]
MSGTYSQFLALPHEFRSVITQYRLMESLYWANRLSKEEMTLRKFILIKVERYREDLHRKRYLFDKRKLDLIRDIATLPLSLRSGYWIQRLKGEPVNQPHKLSQLIRLTSDVCGPCVHPVFSLLNNFTLLVTRPFSLTTIVEEEVMVKRHVGRYRFFDIPFLWKQSYEQRRHALLAKPSLDSLLVLLLQTLFQLYFLKKKRPCEIEEVLWQQFQTLFCYKYPVRYIDFLADQMTELLEFYCLETNASLRSIYSSGYHEQRAHFAKQQNLVHPNLNRIVFSQQRLLDNLNKYKM